MLYKLQFLFFLFVSKKEELKKICDPSSLFQNNDDACDCFICICVKTDNEDCNYFRKSWEQCPRINYNVLSNKIIKCTKFNIFINVLDIKSQMNRSNLNLDGIKNQIKISTSQLNVSLNEIDKKSSNQERIVFACLTFMLLLIIGICFHLKGCNEDKCRKNKITGEDKNESMNTIEKKSSDKDKTFSHENYRSLSDKYDRIDNLKESDFKQCFEVINKFNKEFMSGIIECFKRKSIINEEIKLSLNCLFVSINIISKYAEYHSPAISVSDSSLVSTFDGFVDMISSHHLAERICESILYTMCSLMKLSRNEVNKEFWKNKLEICFLNDKVSEENKLASSVILVQLDISNIELLLQISEYLFKKIDIDCSQEYFGFTHSEIMSARISALNKLENLLKATIDENIDCFQFMIYLKKIIDFTLKLKLIQLNVNEADIIYNVAKKSSENQCKEMIIKSEK